MLVFLDTLALCVDIVVHIVFKIFFFFEKLQLWTPWSDSFP